MTRKRSAAQDQEQPKRGKASTGENSKAQRPGSHGHHGHAGRKSSFYHELLFACEHRLVPVCFMFAITLLLVARTFLHRSAQQEMDSDGKSVERLSFHGFRTYREVASLGRPIVLTDTVADRWLARRIWTVDFLKERLVNVSVHRQCDNPVFITFHDHKKLEPLVSQKREDFNEKVNVDLATVVEEQQSGGEGKQVFFYFSDDLLKIKHLFPDIVRYVEPLDDLVLSPIGVQVNLWVGRRGIVTHTHYDASYNFFVQLRGKKRFTLFAPGQPLYLYPCLHPHYGHSQVDIARPNLTAFPQFLRARQLTIDVLPGDMLVIPPFWFHHVETLEESVSLNVWSDADELIIMDDIYHQPVPFEEAWNSSAMIVAARVYAEMVVHAIAEDFSLVWDSVKERYQPVVDHGHISVNISAITFVQSVCHSKNWLDETTHLSSKFNRGVILLKPLFAKIAHRAIRQVCLANFLEHLVATVLPIDHIYPFFLSCFDGS